MTITQGTSRAPHAPRAFQEVWTLRIDAPGNPPKALWLRFNVLVTKNGFRRVAETWALLFQHDQKREVSKSALKQTYDIDAFHLVPGELVRIGDCELSLNADDPGKKGSTKGAIHSKNHTLRWDLTFSADRKTPFKKTPEILTRTRILTGNSTTLWEDLAIEGEIQYDGTPMKWSMARGMLSHFCGPRYDHSWVWGHANDFTNDRGEPAHFVFEGSTTRPYALGTVRLPAISSFYFLYGGNEFVFNSLWDSVRSKSAHSLTQWDFQADRGELSFRGKLTAEHKDFAGLSFEDTNGSLLYAAISKLSHLSIHVYRAGKLENSFYANGKAGLELTSRSRNPYVPMLL